jgi:hypothetical protein
MTSVDVMCEECVIFHGPVTAFVYLSLQWTGHAAPRAVPRCSDGQQNNWLSSSNVSIDVADIAAVVLQLSVRQFMLIC